MLNFNLHQHQNTVNGCHRRVVQSSPSAAQMNESNSPTRALLGQVADALGVPVANFLTDLPHEETLATTEQCLHLWSEITTEEGRRQALQALQMIVRREEALRSKDL